jgi:hypothetical protein
MPCTIVERKIEFAGKVLTLPILRDARGHYLNEANEWLHEQIQLNRILPTSGKAYAEHLASLFTFIEGVPGGLNSFCDYDLLTWMNEQDERGLARQTIQARRDAAFRFFMWLCDYGQPDLIRLPGREYPRDFVPRLSSRLIRTRRSGRIYESFVSGVGVPGRTSQRLPTPTTNDVAKLRVVSEEEFPDRTASEWHQAVLSWMHDLALRRKEFRALTLAQIPDESRIDELILGGEVHMLTLSETKGGSPRSVGVLPSLLQATRDYIDGPRREIVNRFKAKHVNYVEPKEVFLSSKTGLPFCLRSISNLLTSLFRSAGVAGHGHRIRATSLTNLFNAEYEAHVAAYNSKPAALRKGIDFEAILLRVAERAGHKDPETLRPYLSVLKKRYEREQGLEGAVNMEMHMKSLTITVTGLEARKERLLRDLRALKSEM